jgi:hypothetical protein
MPGAVEALQAIASSIAGQKISFEIVERELGVDCLVLPSERITGGPTMLCCAFPLTMGGAAEEVVNGGQVDPH